MEVADLYKIIEEIEALEFLKFFTNEHKWQKNCFYIKKQNIKSDKFYIISESYPIFSFTAKEDFYGKEFVELAPQVQTFNKKFADLPYFNIQGFEIYRIQIETDKKFYIKTYDGRYSVEIWRNYIDNDNNTCKMLISTYYGKSFSQLQFLKELYFFDILTRYSLISRYDYVKLRYFGAFKFFRGVGYGEIYKMIKKMEFVTTETSVNRVGRDNSFTTTVDIKHLPTDGQVRDLIVQYYEKLGFEYRFSSLTKAESYFAYSPPEPYRRTTVNLGEFEAANLYKYILDNYNYEIEKLNFYENQLNEIIEKMKGVIKVNQVWASDAEKFEVLEEKEGDIIISGLTDVKFLNLKKNQVCHINKEALESFLKEEMNMFYIV